MSIESALPAVAVADLEEAKEFYTRLFGRPADLSPMPTLAQWDVGPVGGGFQLVEQPELAGKSMATLFVSEFDATLNELRERGIDLGEVVEGKVSQLTQVSDPAGNVITVAEVPSD